VPLTRSEGPLGPRSYDQFFFKVDRTPRSLLSLATLVTQEVPFFLLVVLLFSCAFSF